MNVSKVFLDSNITLYALSGDALKKRKALELLANNSFISTQIVGENVNVCLRKLRMTKTDAFAHGAYLMEACTVVEIYQSTIRMAFYLSEKYMVSYWDALVLATALENECDTLFSEDMQNGSVIEGNLTVRNPFV